jgi:hypothetical protein
MTDPKEVAHRLMDARCEDCAHFRIADRTNPIINGGYCSESGVSFVRKPFCESFKPKNPDPDND